MNARNLFRYEPIAAGILRIMAGLLFLAHGTQKFLSFPPGETRGLGSGLCGPRRLRRHHRTGLRAADRDRLVHPSRGVSRFGHDGGRLFLWRTRRRTSSRSTIWATQRSCTASSSSIFVFRGAGALSVDGDRKRRRSRRDRTALIVICGRAACARAPPSPRNVFAPWSTRNGAIFSPLVLRPTMKLVDVCPSPLLQR